MNFCLRFQVKVVGKPKPDFSCTSFPGSDGKAPEIRAVDNETYELTWLNVEQPDLVEYSCTATNVLGVATKTILLTGALRIILTTNINE